MKIRQKRVLAYVLAMVMVLNLCAVPVKAESVDEENPLTTQIMKTNISNSTMYFVYDSANKDYSYSLTITKDEAVNDITLDASKLCISASNGDDSLPIQEKTYTADSTSLKADYITSAPTYDNDFTIDGNSKDGFRIQLSDDKFAEKKNNSFILWCQNDSGDEWYYVATFKVSIEKYTIQYDFGGKGGFAEDYTDAPEDFYEGDTVTLPTEENIVAKDGYTFAGWYLNERYDEGSVKEITKDKADANKTVKLYAKWEQKITYSIKYQLDDTNSDTKSSTDIEELKSDFSARETAKPGYTFDGWYMEKNNEKVKITADNLEDNLKANTNITLYPKWYYTIKFETNTGETVTDQTVELSAEKSTDALSQITKNKYKFAGWYVKGTENKVDTIKDVTEKRDNNSDTVTLEAKWSFTIRFENATFSDSNKYPSNSKEYYYGQDISLPTQSEMTNAGEFQGWYTDESFTNSVEKITESLAADDSSEFTLYAKWEQKTTYSIKYQLDDTNSDTKSSTDIEELKSDFSARETAKPGYTFDGWYMEKNNEKVKITADNLEDNLKANTNITLYPKWYYTIKFETNTGETVTDQTVELSAEKSTDALSQITKNKYKFAGWYVKGTENKVDTIKDVTEKRDNNSDTVTLEAKWSFTIRFENATFSDSNKYPSNSKEYYYGQDISLPTQSEMTNAGEFQGWYTDESFTNSVEKITESLAADDSSEFTLYAKWISTSPSPSPSDNSLNQSPSPTKDPSPSVAPAPTVTPSVQPTESTDGIKINGKDVKNNQKISVCLGASITITASSKITIVPKAKKNQKKCLKVSVKNNKGTIKVKSLCRNAIKVIITVKSKKTSTTIWINTKVPTPKFKVKINKSRTKITISIKNKSVAKKIGCYTVEALNKNTKNKFVYIATNKFKLLGAGGRKYPTGEYKFKVRFWNTKKPVKKGKLLTKKYMYSEQVQKLKVR